MMDLQTEGATRAGKEARAAVMGHICRERDRQDGLWPEQAPGAGSIEPHTMVAILTEEVGEVAKAALEGDDSELRTELVQTAAVCVKWLENLDATAPADASGGVPTDRELGAAITDPGDDGSGWGR